MRIRPNRVGVLAAAVCVLCVLWHDAVCAAIDLNGLWRVGVFVSGSVFPESDVCAVRIVQRGTTLAITGGCLGAANPIVARGSIDPGTGSFFATGSAGACAAVAVSGTAVFDAGAFTGTFNCTARGVTGGITGSRCGNGRIDADEQCDDGNVVDGDCCDSTCTAAAVGALCTDDGNVCTADTCDADHVCQHPERDGRRCDDGNPCTVGDRCLAGQCGMPQPDDAPCSDANACTTADRCVAGTCRGEPVGCDPCLACDVTRGCVPTISTGCHEARASSVALRRRGVDTVSWIWQRGETTLPADFGSPATTTDYEFCIYDSQGGLTAPPRVVMARRAAAGGDWLATPRGHRYSHRDTTPLAVSRIRLTSGPAGRSRIAVWQQGRDLGLSPLQSIAAPITAQLKARNPAGAQCWSAVYDRVAAVDAQSIRAAHAPHAPESRPNIIVVALDDVRADGVDRMPTVAQLAADGVSFTNAFAVNPLCAPSRASLLTGLHSPRHGVRALGGVIGGAARFRLTGADRQTIATWLQAAGYMTGLFGKYVNNYEFGDDARRGPGGAPYVPPGWSRWRAMTTPEHFGGIRGVPYTLVDEHGHSTAYTDQTTDRQYSTDVLAAQLRAFVADAVSQQRPFLAVWTPYAGHIEVPSLRPEPALRHFQFFRALEPWRPPSYAEADMSDKPRSVRGLTEGTTMERTLTDQMRIGAYETLLSVDEQLHALLADLVRLGIDHRTIIVVTSDNGVGWGEHRVFFQGKECPYEECLRIPMIVRDPRSAVRGVTYGAAVLSIDVAPTVAEWSGVEPPVPSDGVSFASWTAGFPPPDWRDSFLIEHWRAFRDDTVDYVGQVHDGDRIRVLSGDTRHHPRPTALFEFDSGDGVGAGAIAVSIGADADASFAALGDAVARAVPSARALHVPVNNRLTLVDISPDHSGVYLIYERDQGGVLRHLAGFGDWFGVRDVARALTYAEHESGEVELYDLALDPHQLDNKAADPAYADTRRTMALRLAELLP